MELKLHPDKVGRIDGVKLPPASIKIDPLHNIRDMASERTRAHIDELKIAIKAWGGVKDPIEGRMIGEDFYVTDGECRLTAVMELIRDEGFECKSLVCIKEAAGTDDLERILNFGISGTKERYTPFEMAEWCRRASRAGASETDIAAAAGWKSVASVKQHLEMLEIAEPIKEHVRNGEISATLARNIAKGVDPVKAEELIRANLEENKRIRGTGKRNVKVTAKTLKRDARPKLDATNIEGRVYVTKAGTDHVVSEHDLPPQRPIDAATDQVNAAVEALKSAANGGEQLGEPITEAELLKGLVETLGPQRTPIAIDRLIEALAPFAKLAHDFDFNEKSDDDLAEVPFKHLKKAWVVFAAVTGATTHDADEIDTATEVYR